MDSEMVLSKEITFTVEEYFKCLYEMKVMIH